MKLRKHLQDAIEGQFMDGVASCYFLSVNYRMSIEEAVKLGQYDWADSDINARNFPTKRAGMADIGVELIHFNRVISTKDALHELNKMGLRPAELHELLAFGKKYPNVQREFPIVALGSVWRDRYGDRLVSCLLSGGLERGLDLDCFGDGWSYLCRFAAVRK